MEARVNVDLTSLAVITKIEFTFDEYDDTSTNLSQRAKDEVSSQYPRGLPHSFEIVGKASQLDDLS